MNDPVEVFKEVQRIAKRFTHSHDDYEELVAESCSKAFANNRFDLSGVYHVVQSTAFDKTKRRRYDRERMENLFAVCAKHEPQEMTQPCPLVVSKNNPISMLANGFSYEEIAKKHDIPLGTVRSRINRLRKKFQKMFTEG